MIWGDLSDDTLYYLLVKDPKCSGFSLLPKIRKCLHNIPGRPVISNCGFYTESISSFLDHHLHPAAQNVNSFIKKTNHYLQKIMSLGQPPEKAIGCTINVIGLNIPHEEQLTSLKDSQICEDGEKSDNWNFSRTCRNCYKEQHLSAQWKNFKTVMRYSSQTDFKTVTESVPPYAIIFMAHLEERILEAIELQPHIWWKYIQSLAVWGKKLLT